MKKLALVITLSTLAVALFACSPPAPDDTTSESPQNGPVESSATVDGLIYLLTVPAVTLDAGADGVATYSVTNSTDATLSIDPLTRMTITGSDGTIIVDTKPPGSRFLASTAEVGPGEVFWRLLPFEVPEPGTYTIALPEVIDPATSRPLTVGFESVTAS